ncbi:MAG: tRNA pseudouridine(55) synthase TruB [Treponema sp.]|nr:tRNA pseudouridine(55) synthase TruB [Treponema sp.]
MKESSFHGLLLLNKKEGLTSFESLAAVKKAFGTGKVGHTGTLDKFARGLLVILLGRGLKLIPLFKDQDKDYQGSILFGAETDTLDPEGEVIAQGPIPSREDLERALPLFRGDIMQTPPAYSALHIGGQRAHELARQGQAPVMQERPAHIYQLELLSYEPPRAQIRVRVSAGTYIRSLARDLALACGSRAHLTELCRRGVGAYSLEEGTEDRGVPEDWIKALRPLDRNLFEGLGVPTLELGPQEERDFLQGKDLRGRLPQGTTLGAQGSVVGAQGATSEALGGRDDLAGVFSQGGRLLGYLRREGGAWKYGHVYANP